VSSKKTADKKTADKKTTAQKTTAKKTAPKKPPAKAAAPGASSTGATQLASPGDVIVVDSMKVGSPAREGEVLEVIRGPVTVSYRIQWTDGHQTLLTPSGGNARVVRSSSPG
jgi:sRNA-binding protein